MKNKILIELIVPTLEETYDVYIPINKRVGNIATLLTKVVNELSGGYYSSSQYTALYNGETGERYKTNQLIRNSDIRNGSKVILM